MEDQELGVASRGQDARPQGQSGVAATPSMFDTSGHFHVMPGHPLHRFMAVNRIEWSDLSPFVQGYVEALFADLDRWIERYGDPAHGPDQNPPRFSDLAPETLARIMEDCERYDSESAIPLRDSPDAGRELWEQLQRGGIAQEPTPFPPLTPYVRDGKVYLRSQNVEREAEGEPQQNSAEPQP